MKILEINKSLEKCTESGWLAFDFILDRQIDSQFITCLKDIGPLVSMSMLRKPFFKVESDYFLLKDLEGDHFFRMGVHHEHLNEKDKIEKMIHSFP